MPCCSKAWLQRLGVMRSASMPRLQQAPVAMDRQGRAWTLPAGNLLLCKLQHPTCSTRCAAWLLIHHSCWQPLLHQQAALLLPHMHRACQLLLLVHLCSATVCSWQRRCWRGQGLCRGRVLCVEVHREGCWQGSGQGGSSRRTSPVSQAGWWQQWLKQEKEEGVSNGRKSRRTAPHHSGSCWVMRSPWQHGWLVAPRHLQQRDAVRVQILLLLLQQVRYR